MNRAEKRAAIADMLRAGATYREIAQTLNVGSHTTISTVRKAEGIPVVTSRRRPGRTAEQTFRLYAEPYGDGHARWTGPWAGRSPQICLPGPERRKVSALRVAFRIRTGREPEGNVKPGCGERGCIAPGHVDDRVGREAVRRMLAAIGGVP